ncbi:MAG: hypothetical protein ACSHX0_00690 [Akkermansiaceae bacterium]
MKTKNSWIKLTGLGLVSALLFSNCVPTYNARGQLVQTVDPAAAVIGAVAIGAIAYSVGKDNRRSHRQYRQPTHYIAPAPYYVAPRRRHH